MPGKDILNKNKTKKNKKVKFKDDILSETVKDFEQRKKDRHYLELQWRLNLDFYDGNQYAKINKVTKDVEEVRKVNWYQEMESFNQIAPIVETRLAKLGRLAPIPKTRPATNTDDDIANSKVCNKILETSYYDKRMSDKQSIANVWSEITGTVINKIIWNPDDGRAIAKTEDTELYEGDLDIIIVNPFEIYPDSLWHESIKECNSIIHAKAYTIKDVKDIWGEDVEGGKVNVLTVEGSGATTGGLGNTSNNPKIAKRMQDDSIIVIEKWERPSKDYPNGRLIICTKNELLYMGDLPHKVEDDDELGLPFTLQKCLKVPGQFFGRSIIERLIPLQRRYNAIKNRKAEYINRVAIGQMVYQDGSLDEDTLDMLEEDGAAPGAMIPYKTGFNPPTYMQFGNLPTEIEVEERNILDDFVRISGVSELSKDSSTPVGINSGIALGILQEQDDTRLSLSASYIVESNIEIGKLILRFYKQYADTDRLLRTIGNNYDIEVITWNNSQITTDDVYVDSQSKSIESLAQRRNMVFDLLNAGLFNNPDTGTLDKEGIKQIFSLIQLGNWEIGNSTNELHIQKAERENRTLSQGEFNNINTYDDHILHIKIHNRFRLSSDYERLIEQNPQINNLFEYHVMQHIEFIRSQTQPQQPVENEQAVGSEQVVEN